MANESSAAMMKWLLIGTVVTGAIGGVAASFLSKGASTAA